MPAFGFPLMLLALAAAPSPADARCGAARTGAKAECARAATKEVRMTAKKARPKEAADRERCASKGDGKRPAKRQPDGSNLELLTLECPNAAQRLVPGLF
jgi:hypothetical protein